MKKVARADGFLLMNRLGLLTLGYFSFVWLSIGRDSDSARTSRSVPLCGSFFYYYYCKIIIILVPFSFPVLLFDWRVGPAVHCFRLKRTHSVTIRRICRGETSPSVARRLVFDKIIFSSPLKKTNWCNSPGRQPAATVVWGIDPSRRRQDSISSCPSEKETSECKFI